MLLINFLLLEFVTFLVLLIYLNTKITECSGIMQSSAFVFIINRLDLEQLFSYTRLLSAKEARTNPIVTSNCTFTIEIKLHLMQLSPQSITAQMQLRL